MKNFIDRTLPSFEPWLVEDSGHPGKSGHPDRYPRDRAMLLVSPCGFPEFDHFVPPVQYFQFFAQKLRWRYLGEILRPGGESLSDKQYQETFVWYYNLVRQAGEQITSARDGLPRKCRRGCDRTSFQADRMPSGTKPTATGAKPWQGSA